MMGNAAGALEARVHTGSSFKWNRHPASAIIATFGEHKPDALYERLHLLRPEDWAESENWLERSGLELYFLERLKFLGIEDAVPMRFLLQMEQNFADNNIRTAGLFDEFVRINQLFIRAQFNYCNVMGISVVPTSCPNPALRRQLSLDFLVARSDREMCEVLLAELGYKTHDRGEHFREYRPQVDEPRPDLTIYESFTNRSIGVYFLSAAAEGVERAPYDMLMRRRTKTWNGFEFPALTESDHFLALSIRMLGHIGIEWNRLAFLLEFRACVRFWQHDKAFWGEVIDRAREHPLRPVAIGSATRVAVEIFGGDIPLPLRDWALDNVDAHILQWSEVYRWDSLVAGFPDATLLAVLEGSRAGA